MGLSKLCPPVGFCFCLNEWTKAASRALLCLGYSLGLQNASREISSSLVPKYSRRMSENLCPLHHTELVGNGSAFWKRSKTIQSVPFPEVKLCNKTFLKHHYQDLFDTHAVLSDSCPKATWDPSPVLSTQPRSSLGAVQHCLFQLYTLSQGQDASQSPFNLMWNTTLATETMSNRLAIFFALSWQMREKNPDIPSLLSWLPNFLWKTQEVLKVLSPPAIP